MAEAFIFWAMKPLTEIALGLAVVAILGALVLLASIPQWMRQKRCNHTRYLETSACEAICRDCGKNLGFIGNVRKDSPQ